VRLRFLGTGTSFGVPQIGCSCDVCRSPDPRDKRTRSGAIVETATGGRILIDAPPELRLQLIAAGVTAIDALLITHDHADHTHGIDDIRALTVGRPFPLPVYGPPEALTGLTRKFPYIFDKAIKPVPGTSKPEGQARPVEPGDRLSIAGVEVEVFEMPHGPMRVYGYRTGPLAYVTDAQRVPPNVLARLTGVDVLVINGPRQAALPTHLSIGDAIEVATQVGARRTFLTHLTHDRTHAALLAELPPGVEPAYDGLAVEMD